MSLSPEERSVNLEGRIFSIADDWNAGMAWPSEKIWAIIEAEINEAILDDRMTRTVDDLYKLSYENGYKAGFEELQSHRMESNRQARTEAYEAGRKAGFEDKSILEKRLDTLTNQVNDMRKGMLGDLEALLEAERRGFEKAKKMAAKVAQDWIDNDCVGPNPANRIRALQFDEDGKE